MYKILSQCFDRGWLLWVVYCLRGTTPSPAAGRNQQRQISIVNILKKIQEKYLIAINYKQVSSNCCWLQNLKVKKSLGLYIEIFRFFMRTNKCIFCSLLKFTLGFFFLPFFVYAGDACPNYCWQLLQRSVGLRLKGHRRGTDCVLHTVAHTVY